MNKILTAGLFALELGISALADSKDEPAYNSETLPPPRYIPSGWTEEVAKNMFGHQIMLINQRSMSRPIFYFETLARDYSVWFKLDENNSVMFTDSRDEKELDEIAFFYRGERNAKISLTGEIKEKLEQNPNIEVAFVSSVSPVIGTHAGPGALLVGICPVDN